MASIWSLPQWVNTYKRGSRYHSLQSLIIIVRDILHDLNGLLDDIGYSLALQWRHYERDGVSNHQNHDCLLNSLFRCRLKKVSKLRVTGLCVRGIHQWPVNSPHKGPVTRKMYPFDVIMTSSWKPPLQAILKQCSVEIIWVLVAHHFQLPGHLGPSLLTWINFNPSMNKWSHAKYGMGWNYLSNPKLKQLHCWSLEMNKQFRTTFCNWFNHISMVESK